MTHAAKPVMKPEEFRLFREYVEATFGLVLDADKEFNLTSRIAERLKELGLSTFADYYARLKFAPHRDEERLTFISYLTNNETYFFREEPQLQVFVEHVLQALMIEKKRKGVRRIRILSAGCSTGEEVYTLAMLLFEAGLFVWEWEIQIIGIDIDHHAIATAQRGLYRDRAFRSTSDYFLEKYFIANAHGYEVRESLRKITRFMHGNILDIGTAPDYRHVDIIFCRNVLIYFSDETITHIVGGFAKILSPGGLLFLGHSESLLRLSTRFLPIRYPGAILYRLKDGTETE